MITIMYVASLLSSAHGLHSSLGTSAISHALQAKSIDKEWKPDEIIIRKLEREITLHRNGKSIKKRIRFYTGTFAEGRRLIKGTLWDHPTRLLSVAMPDTIRNMPLKPINIVANDELPWALFERHDPTCPAIIVEYDVGAAKFNYQYCYP